ncbi:hypothetical protein PHLGIDRAFT_30927 [Phlebiopsis gigantea 11061_1 CR5-6]|uniref:Galactokinase n=1 Tax=Phlebiopsis gigantea (strain 11061_1 CR5-6) TaxID=745531 RepID=A0A0C3NKA7_PHLG1|nr:hypothetical protein PHLGIDRAFT_30927 [Phlebiopsis gigantea 11061_1 CR5-6]
MATEPVPIFTSVIDAHPIPAIATREAARFDALVSEFTQRFGHKPAYIARAPGRVNIIGEHIDYALFGVFPAAVEQDVLIACARRPDDLVLDGGERGHVHAQNLQPKYTPQTFAPMLRDAAITQNTEQSASSHVRLHQWHLDIDPRQLRWESYVKAGYYGVLERFFTPSGSAALESEPVNTDILVTGTIPAGSGLSSSAAMVVASTLAFLAVNDKLDIATPDAPTRRITKGELVSMAVENEKRVGVNSGGMDQAASVTALPSTALYISFYPVFHAEPVPLPIRRTARKAVWVCANSLVQSEKVLGAKTRYNLRVVETLVAARILARVLGLSALLASGDSKFTLREVLAAYVGSGEAKGAPAPALTPEQLSAGLERMLDEVERLRPARLAAREAGADAAQADAAGEELGLTYDEMVRFSGLDAAAFHATYLSWVEVEATRFQIYKRTKHVFSEALRVLRFRAADADALPESTLHDLGALMSASQASCSALFECSCPELDALTALALRSGAYGSRLTGAGWGGCTVSLVAEDEAEAFIARLVAGYPPYAGLGDEARREAVFATVPSNGAFVFKLG